MINRNEWVSVVVPVYNGVSTLPSLLSSLANQTYPWVEIVIVDDGSTDGSYSLCRAFDYKNIRVFRCEKNSGYGNAMRIGCEASRGEYIARADADDICHRCRIEMQVQFLKDHREISFVGTRRWLITPGGRRLGISSWPKSGEPWIEETWESIYSGRRLFADPSVMVRREAVEAVGGWRNYQRSGMDVDLWFRLLERGYRGATLKEPLYYRRLAPEGLIFSENTGIKNKVVRLLADQRRECGSDFVMRGERIPVDCVIKKPSWPELQRHGSFHWTIGGDCARRCDFLGAFGFGVAAIRRGKLPGCCSAGIIRFVRGLWLGMCLGGRILWRKCLKANLAVFPVMSGMVVGVWSAMRGRYLR